MAYKMTKEEREAFLAELHVGIIGINDQKRGPLMVPIWYSYTPGGEIKFVTEKNSRKAQLLRAEMRFSLCVQKEETPYQYVSVEGQVTSIEDANHQRDLLPLSVRYLGKEEGEKYAEETQDDDEIVIHMKPEKWSTADYGKE
jgi:PPOX class probable F420-dependent enzyme